MPAAGGSRAPRQRSGFVDEAQLHAKGGDGGAGVVSFRREAHVARGGPDGGDGGHGGGVWPVATSRLSSLLSFRDQPFRRGADGGHGQGRKRHGKRGPDAVIEVPEGTVVRELGGDVVCDLDQPGMRWCAAAGGRGGRGNARFLTNRRRAPSFAEQGERGEEHWYDLELKLMADVALVGFPNAGKSTLISRISAARPKIADYPFTTLEPHLGVVRVDDGPEAVGEFVVADVPGLVEGAAEGRGLGHAFLRHVERSRVLVVLVDLSPMAERPPAVQEGVLVDELRRYRPDLLGRPRIVVGSKADAAADGAGGWDGPRFSSLTGEGLVHLVGAMADSVARERASAQGTGTGHGRARVPGTVVVHRPVREGAAVAPDGAGGWRVTGRAAERAVALDDLTNPDALAYVQGRLRRLGVERALARAGARSGDVVRIGSFEFEYEPDA